MPLRRGKPLTFRPGSVVDAVDGTNAPPGGMRALTNLIPDPSTASVYVPRPAALQKTNFDWIANPGFVSSCYVVGNIAYGTIASDRTPGSDEPFAYDILNNASLFVAGITTANVPLSPPATGAWTPPILAQIGGRVVVTHPGFPGGDQKFGWFDVSGFTETVMGNTATSATITGNPSIIGVQPGMTVSGVGIPAGDTVVSTAPFVLVTTGDTHTSTTLDNLASTTDVAVGQTVSGAGILDGTTVAALLGPTSVTLSQAAVASAGGVTVTFGGATITLSQAATATANGVMLTIAGGTPTVPLWGAGDTDRNPLVAKPVGVAQFFGRAYFALGKDGLQFSDPGFPTRISNFPAVQALVPGNGLPVTAVYPLMLSSPLVTTGIVQALIAFQGATAMQQITGDPVFNNLSMNALPMATGTLAPLSLFTCELGTGFVSPEGARIIQFDGKVSDPIGQFGSGVSVPFMFAVQPSRVVAAANRHVIRLSTQNGADPMLPMQEYWYDIGLRRWTGPHSFPASLIQPWGTSFVMAPAGITGKLFQSDPVPNLASTYVENGTALRWIYQTLPLPDNEAMAENALIEMTLDAVIGPASSFSAIAADITGDVLAVTTIEGGGAASLWGSAIWGLNVWGGSSWAYQQLPVNWPVPLVFKQLVVSISGESAYNVKIGNLYMRYQILGYLLQVA